MDNHQRSLLQILIGLLVGVVVFGGIFYLAKNLFQKQSSKTTTKTAAIPLDVDKEAASWQTFQSSKFNFSIKFPQGSGVVEDINGSKVSFLVDKNCQEDICEGVYLLITTLPQGYDQASASASQRIKKGPGGLNNYTVKIIQGDKLYIFNLFTNPDNEAANKRNFDLMVKTLKFLK